LSYISSYINIQNIVLLLCVIIFAANVYSHFYYTPDDTYIYLQFAKNIIHGNGIAFNAGEPTYGITSPLWLFIISAGGIVGFDLYLLAKIIDILLACTSLIVFYVAIFPLVQDFAVRICATMAFSLNVWLVRWTGTGMETSLGIILVVISIGFLLRGNYLLSSGFTGLLGLVRPEGLLLYVIVAAIILRTQKGNAMRLLGASLILVALPIIPWLIYAYHTFGTILPNTALAKAGLSDSILGRISTFMDIAETATVSDGISILVCIFLSALIVYDYKYWKNNKSDQDETAENVSPRILMIVGWIIILPVFYIIADVNFISRYLLLLTPVILMCAYYLINEALSRYFKSRYLYPVILAFTMLVMLQNQIAYFGYVKPGIDRFSDGMQSTLIQIGRWFQSNTPKETRIFAQDVGAIGYYSDRYICDAAGLISPSLLKLQRLGFTHKRMIDEKVYTSLCKANYVVYRSLVPDELNNRQDLVTGPTYRFLQMSLSDINTYYYTVYAVRSFTDMTEQGEQQNE
jgi:hypothetical protein